MPSRSASTSSGSWRSAARIPAIKDEPFSMTVLAARHQRLRPTASASCTATVTRKMWQRHLAGLPARGSPDHFDHQRRAHPQLDLPGDRPALLTATSARAGRRSPTDHAASGSASTTSPTPSSGAYTRTRRERLVALRPRAPRGPAAAARRARRRSRRGRRSARPRRPDHRLRPPLRHLQARRLCSSATSSASQRILNDPGPARADSSSPARPTRTTTAART